MTTPKFARDEKVRALAGIALDGTPLKGRVGLVCGIGDNITEHCCGRGVLPPVYRVLIWWGDRFEEFTFEEHELERVPLCDKPFALGQKVRHRKTGEIGCIKSVTEKSVRGVKEMPAYDVWFMRLRLSCVCDQCDLEAVDDTAVAQSFPLKSVRAKPKVDGAKRLRVRASVVVDLELECDDRGLGYVSGSVLDAAILQRMPKGSRVERIHEVRGAC